MRNQAFIRRDHGREQWRRALSDLGQYSVSKNGWGLVKVGRELHTLWGFALEAGWTSLRLETDGETLRRLEAWSSDVRVKVPVTLPLTVTADPLTDRVSPDYAVMPAFEMDKDIANAEYLFLLFGLPGVTPAHCIEDRYGMRLRIVGVLAGEEAQVWTNDNTTTDNIAPSIRDRYARYKVRMGDIVPKRRLRVRALR